MGLVNGSPDVRTSSRRSGVGGGGISSRQGGLSSDQAGEEKEEFVAGEQGEGGPAAGDSPRHHRDASTPSPPLDPRYEGTE